MEKYSRFEKREVHPMEKYIGRLAAYRGEALEVVGYTTWSDSLCSLIVDASENGGWRYLADDDVVFKKCEGYLYVDTDNLID